MQYIKRKENGARYNGHQILIGVLNETKEMVGDDITSSKNRIWKHTIKTLSQTTDQQEWKRKKQKKNNALSYAGKLCMGT